MPKSHLQVKKLIKILSIRIGLNHTCTFPFHNINRSRTCVKVTQWENMFTRCQSKSKSHANFDAMIWGRLASLLHMSRSTKNVGYL